MPKPWCRARAGGPHNPFATRRYRHAHTEGRGRVRADPQRGPNDRDDGDVLQRPTHGRPCCLRPRVRDHCGVPGRRTGPVFVRSRRRRPSAHANGRADPVTGQWTCRNPPRGGGQRGPDRLMGAGLDKPAQRPTVLPRGDRPIPAGELTGKGVADQPLSAGKLAMGPRRVPLEAGQIPHRPQLDVRGHSQVAAVWHGFGIPPPTRTAVDLRLARSHGRIAFMVAPFSARPLAPSLPLEVAWPHRRNALADPSDSPPECGVGCPKNLSPCHRPGRIWGGKGRPQRTPLSGPACVGWCREAGPFCGPARAVGRARGCAEARGRRRAAVGGGGRRGGVLAAARAGYAQGQAEFDVPADRTALLVIDMQDEFVRPEWSPYWVPGATRLAPRLARFIAACRSLRIPVILSTACTGSRYSCHPITSTRCWMVSCARCR
jgi:hypothetical protein